MISQVQRWPVRWRLTLASATLTAAILIAFAMVIGRLATDRLRSDFNGDLRSAAGSLAVQVRVENSGLGPVVHSPLLDDYAASNAAVIRIVTASGDVLTQSTHAPTLGPPRRGLVRERGLEVASAPVVSNELGLPPVYVQYGRSVEDLERTIHRLWLFLAAGALAGTALATLAGLAVAGRAMRPISTLTASAREIADTRDPSRRIPMPETDDEVAELARTLEQMLRSLDAARAEREQAMQTQREFVADASHELRTPLTSVLANLELLEETLARDEGADKREMVGSALRSSRRMSRLVSDLLLLARADAGRPGQRRGCDLAEIAAAALTEVEPVAGSRSLSLSAPEPVPVSGSPDELHRMVVNLVDNAVRHTPDRSTISVVVRAEDGRAVLEVADDGPGLPAGLQGQVFDRFVRGAGPADTAGGAGTGLGLAIVRAVAESHEGTVEAMSSPHGGALFRIRLPLAGGARSERAVRRPLGAV